MADSLFDKLQAQAFKGGVAPRTAESLKWFRTKLQRRHQPYFQGDSGSWQA